MRIPLILSNLVLDETLRSPVVILAEEGGTRSLRAPLAPLEANALAMAHAGQDTAESYSTDLARNLITSLGAELRSALISAGEGGLLRARLELAAGQGSHYIDCRIADALILSLRMGCGLFADDGAFTTTEGSPADILRRHIAETDTLSFGSLTLS